MESLRNITKNTNKRLVKAIRKSKWLLETQIKLFKQISRAKKR